VRTNEERIEVEPGNSWLLINERAASRRQPISPKLELNAKTMISSPRRRPHGRSDEPITGTTSVTLDERSVALLSSTLKLVATFEKHSVLALEPTKNEEVIGRHVNEALSVAIVVADDSHFIGPVTTPTTRDRANSSFDGQLIVSPGKRRLPSKLAQELVMCVYDVVGYSSSCAIHPVTRYDHREVVEMMARSMTNSGVPVDPDLINSKIVCARHSLGTCGHCGITLSK
jgi:hypothetical protein